MRKTSMQHDQNRKNIARCHISCVIPHQLRLVRIVRDIESGRHRFMGLRVGVAPSVIDLRMRKL